MEKAKWTTANHTKGWPSSKEGDGYVVELKESPLVWAPSRKPIHSNKYFSQLDQMKATLNKKHLKLAENA